MTTFLTVYLQLNLLLALAWMLWRASQWVGKVGHFETGHQQALNLARALFVSLPLVLLLSYLLNGVVYQALPTVAGTMTITPVVTESLARDIGSGGTSLTLAGVLLAVLVSGLLIQLWCFFGKFRVLQRIIHTAIPWKEKTRVSVLISETASTPFSTSILGRNLIVLPYKLVHTRDHFHIALKHELQHLRNGDLTWVVAMEAVKLLCYWNPFIYLWQNEFDCLQEFACDETLVNRRRLTRQRYGRCLLDVASAQPGKRLLATSNMVPRFSLWMKVQSQLRRRVNMLKVQEERRFGKSRVIALGGLMAVGILGTSALWMSESSMAQEEQREEEPRVMPVITEQPVYPQQALSNNLEGWVVTGITVTEDGGVSDPEVINSCVVAQNDEDATCLDEHEGLLDQSSLDAIVKFRFEPRGEEVAGVQYKFSYCLSEGASCTNRSNNNNR